MESKPLMPEIPMRTPKETYKTWKRAAFSSTNAKGNLLEEPKSVWLVAMNWKSLVAPIENRTLPQRNLHQFVKLSFGGLLIEA